MIEVKLVEKIIKSPQETAQEKNEAIKKKSNEEQIAIEQQSLFANFFKERFSKEYYLATYLFEKPLDIESVKKIYVNGGIAIFKKENYREKNKIAEIVFSNDLIIFWILKEHLNVFLDLCEVFKQSGDEKLSIYICQNPEDFTKSIFSKDYKTTVLEGKELEKLRSESKIKGGI